MKTILKFNFLFLLLLSTQSFSQFIIDIEGPVLVSVTLDDTVVDISEMAQTISFTVLAYDSLSEISASDNYAWIWSSPSGVHSTSWEDGYLTIQGVNDEGLTVLTGEVTISEGQEPGIWTPISGHILSDSLGNYNYTYLSPSFEVVNTNPAPIDIEGPVLVSVTLDDTLVDISEMAQTISFTVLAYDSLSEISASDNYGWTWSSPSGAHSTSWEDGYLTIQGVNDDGLTVLTGEVTISEGQEPGIWTPSSGHILSDSLGNYNYNHSLSPSFEVMYSGCMDESAYNYNQYATVDNNSCVSYESHVSNLQDEIQELQTQLENSESLYVGIPLELPQGWSMFGYACLESISAADAFEIISDDIVIVKDALGNAYLPELNFNGIGDLKFQQGYLIKVKEEISGFSLCD